MHACLTNVGQHHRLQRLEVKVQTVGRSTDFSLCIQIRLMRQMKEEQKRSKTQESKRMKEMMKLKRDFKMKEVL